MRKLLPIAFLAFIIGLLILTNPLEIFATRRTRTQRVRRTRVVRPTPYRTPTSTIIPTRTPTVTPTAVPIIQPTKRPSVTPPETIVGDEVQTFLMNAINEYRRSVGLSSVQTNNATCDFAKVRAEEITKAFNHDGFSDRLKNNSLPYPSYSQITENIAQTSDYRKVVGMWVASSGHAENMRKDTPYVCVEHVGDYYAYEGWKP